MNNDLHSATALLSHAEEELPRGANDLRSFIQSLADTGRLLRVMDAVDWRFEIGRITRENRSPLLFEHIKDYPNHRVFTNGLCDSASIALALGLPSGIKRKALMTVVRKRVTNLFHPILVETGPVLENIFPKEEASFLNLPIPHWSQLDVDRYVGTWHVNVSRDPETGVRNVGVYRMQLLGPRNATISASPGSHLAKHVAKSEREGRALPVAVAIGVAEAVIIAAAAAFPEGMDEYELAGGLLQQPIPLIRCKTVNLEVPANSEIVIEGLIQPGVRVKDGPYLDYTGKSNVNPNAFLIEVTQIMFRSNPIYRGASIGVQGAEDHQLFAFLAELDLIDFHGSQTKQLIQKGLLKQRLFRTFQFTGRIGEIVRGKRGSSSYPDSQVDCT